MKVYIVAATLGQYQDALRALGLHERAAVHVTAPPVTNRLPPDAGMVYAYHTGQLVKLLDAPRRAA